MTSKLKETREKAGYTVEEVSDILKIRKQYIVDLEEGTIEDIPGQVYVRGYTKLYHEFLGLKFPKTKLMEVATPKSDKLDNNANRIYIILISSIILFLVISIYAFVNFDAPDDLTDNMINDNENNQATIN